MKKAIFFDLFFTLINPQYLDGNENEYDVVGLSSFEWEEYAENDTLYKERAKGNVKTEMEIIDKIVGIIPNELNERQKQEILKRREKRMRRALLCVDVKILDTLRKVRDKGIKIGLISNADLIDSKYWSKSPLSDFFDIIIFSCDVGILKPEIEIYRMAMDKLHMTPEESVFVGDGGSDEIFGAKAAGMTTIFAEHLVCKSEGKKEKILKYTDYHIHEFDELLKYID